MKVRGKAEYDHKQPELSSDWVLLGLQHLRGAKFPWPLQKERNLQIESLKPQNLTRYTWTRPRPF